MSSDIADVTAIPMRDFLHICEGWKADTQEHDRWSEIQADLKAQPLRCPVHQRVVITNSKCPREMVPNTKTCPICGNYCCPDCWNHQVDVLSRVTGYLSTVSGWNAAKKQEFEDRNRYDLEGGPR